MADDTLYTLADIKDYFRECFSNASINSAAKRKFIKYIEAIDKAIEALERTSEDAVPLDKLCAKLAETQMSVRGEPMSLTLDADGWRMIILDWMEE